MNRRLIEPAQLAIETRYTPHDLQRAGDAVKVDDYLDVRGIRRNKLFQQLLQALIELATAGSEERALLESISNHLGARGTSLQQRLVQPAEHPVILRARGYKE